MKRAREVAHEAMEFTCCDHPVLGWSHSNRCDDLATAITARDAEHRAVIERLKGELAEAKRLLIDANVGTRLPFDVREAVLRFLAAPVCTASAGSCNSPAACGEAGKCIDARMREVVAPADDVRLEESLINRITEAKAYVLGRIESHVHCRACGFVLRLENAMVADGCPCNSGRGINHGLVARNTCTCVVCDPARTGGARKPSALDAKGEPGTFRHYFSNDGKKRCEVCGLPDGPPNHPKGAKP